MLQELVLTFRMFLRLHGRNLSFNIADTAQGMFLENENGLTRIAVYNHRGTNVVDVPVPSALLLAATA